MRSPAMPDKDDFKSVQYAFTAHIRDPENNPAPEGIEDRRINIYRNLFYNNIEGFVSSGFPVLRSLYNDDDWHAMVRSFFIKHECHTPYFLEIAQEFIDYLQNEHEMRDCDYPFMLELAHYEWVELAIEIDETENELADVDPDGDLLSGHPQISALAWPLSYQFEVHRIAPEYLPDTPTAQGCHLIVYRDMDDEVCFMEINAVTARLLFLLSEDKNLTGRAALEQIATELQHPSPEAVIKGGLQTLRELKERNIILGTSRT
jgi:hypothetical protein